MKPLPIPDGWHPLPGDDGSPSYRWPDAQGSYWHIGVHFQNGYPVGAEGFMDLPFDIPTKFTEHDYPARTLVEFEQAGGFKIYDLFAKECEPDVDEWEYEFEL